jgi:hypothetical protein
MTKIKKALKFRVELKFVMGKIEQNWKFEADQEFNWAKSKIEELKWTLSKLRRFGVSYSSSSSAFHWKLLEWLPIQDVNASSLHQIR